MSSHESPSTSDQMASNTSATNEQLHAGQAQIRAQGRYAEQLAKKLVYYQSNKNSNDESKESDRSDTSAESQDCILNPPARVVPTGELGSKIRNITGRSDGTDPSARITTSNSAGREQPRSYEDRLARKKEFYASNKDSDQSVARINNGTRSIGSNHQQGDVEAAITTEIPKKEVEDEFDDAVKPGAFAASGLPAGQRPQWMTRARQLADATDNNNSWSSITQNSGNMTVCASSISLGSGTVAKVVDREELKQEFAQSILQDAARAEVVTVDEYKDKSWKYLCATLALAILAITIYISVWLTKKDGIHLHTSPTEVPSLAPTSSPLPTLQTITTRGKLRCAVSGNYDIENTMCKAIAGAVLGDGNKMERVIVDSSNPYDALSNQEADVATTFSKFAMDKDIFQKDTKVGFSFTCPWFYDGYVFGGQSSYLDCALKLDGFFNECNKLRICVHADEAYHAVREWFPGSIIKKVPFDKFYSSFNEGQCNVLSGLSIEVSEAVVKEHIKDVVNYTAGDLRLSKVTTAAVTTDDDAEWSNFVKWVVQSLFAAEQRNITRDNADSFITTDLFGEQYQNMFIDAIKAVGNYGTILAEDPLTSLITRPSIQKPNNGSSGLIYSFPFGEHANNIGPGPEEGSVMKNIKDRGVLRCGVLTTNDSSDWRELGKEYCRALSASLFYGNASKVEFAYLNSTQEAYKALNTSEVDLLSGSRVTLETDVKEQITGKGYAFSLPYFYGVPKGESEQSGNFTSGDSIGLVTREDDYAWSGFVFWIVSATFYAEEKGITKIFANEMPSINLFGEDLKDIYRHAIFAVGNYGEMYQKHVGDSLPRGGRNLLNKNPYRPQIKPMFAVR